LGVIGSGGRRHKPGRCEFCTGRLRAFEASAIAGRNFEVIPNDMRDLDYRLLPRSAAIASFARQVRLHEAIEPLVPFIDGIFVSLRAGLAA
jgi:hypothetical protein